MAQAVPNLCVPNTKLMGILFVVKIGPGPMSHLVADNLAEAFPCWLDVMYQPRSSVCTIRIILGLIINAGVLLNLSRGLTFGGPVIAPRI